MIPQARKYFVLVVHFGSSDVTDRALRSLAAAGVPADHVVVIDHADQPYQTSRQLASPVIRPRTNKGYAAGINLGLGVLLSRGVKADDVVVCLNNDCRLAPDALEVLERWWQAHPTPALVGVGQGHINLLSGRAHVAGAHLLPALSIPYLDGAFLAAPFKIFMELQGLPEKYFMYWEDALLSRRAQRRHIPLRIASGVRVSHVSDKMQPTDQQLYYLVRNGALFLEQETPWPWRHWWWAGNRLRLLYHHLRSGRGRAHIVRRALSDAVRGVTGRVVVWSPPGPTSALPNRATLGAAPTVSAIVKQKWGGVPHSSPPRRGRGKMSVGAVVVTYNSAAWLSGCVASLRREGIRDIVVVDNASTDRSHSLASQLQVLCLQQGHNSGYARAANHGAEQLTNQYLLFLNPDARVTPGSVRAAAKYLDEHPRCAVVGLLLCDVRGVPERDAFGRAVTLLSLLTRKIRASQLSNVSCDVLHPGWVSAGAMIVRRAVFTRLGGFDPEFFLYWEDVDLCRRIRQGGWQVVVLPGARAVHRRGASLTDQQLKARLYDQSADRYFRKHYGAMIWWPQQSLRRIYRLLSPQPR